MILACNTASAKALRTIQQKDLPLIGSKKRVLGVIRPTTEIIGNYTKSKHVGVFATTGTVSSQSYVIEIEKFFPDIHVFQEACPMWVPLIENNELQGQGAEYYVKKYIKNLLIQSPKIDVIILGCTHYPLLIALIEKYLPKNITILTQGIIVANSLKDYLVRHSEIEKTISKNSSLQFLTTDSIEIFDRQGSLFYGNDVNSIHISL